MNAQTILNWYIQVLRDRFFAYEGRARRQEYWSFVLVNFIVIVALSILEMIPGIGFLFGIVSLLYTLVILIPSVTLGIRRLHDIGWSGWWILLGLIPVVGAVALIVLHVFDSEPGSNQYGPNPKE